MVNCYAWYTVSERRGGHPPQPPFQGGKSESEGGMLSLQRGNAVRSAISKQRVVCRVGANLVFALFLCGVGNIRTRISQMTRINTNNCVCHSASPLCHSERSEESREEERGDSSLTL